MHHSIFLVSDAEQAVVSSKIEAELLASLALTNVQSSNGGFVFGAHNREGQLIGGLSASTSYGWLNIKTLWVDIGSRGAGVGRNLMAHAHEKGRELGCHAAWLDTSSVAARAFYLRLDYVEFAQLANVASEFPPEHQRWFMKCQL